jgi:peptide/nickel transport system substrate-binding protein
MWKKSFDLMTRIPVIIRLFILLCVLCLAACTSSGVKLPWQKTATLTAAPSVTSAPTQAPTKELTVCLGEEPVSLYLYAERQSAAMWSVLEAIYDGPIDEGAGKYKAVILQKVPAFEDGDLTQTAIPVSSGNLVVDANDNIVALENGVSILPSGCKDSSCSIVWDGISEIKMDQVTAKFLLRNNLLWSDGMSLTAEDSLFSFTLDSDPATSTGKWRTDITYSYEMLDDLTLQWKGLPGYQGLEAQGMFWVPLPKHLLGGLPVSEIENADLATRTPMGWGPYVITEWVSGDHIRLEKNGNYFRASEGLPVFDQLVYRFIDPNGGGSLAALAAGQCDLLERSSDPQSNQVLVTDLLNSTDAKAEWKTGPEIVQLVIGMKPASYDNGYNAAIDRYNYFGDPITRQAMALCIDRQTLNIEIFNGKAGLASVADLLENQSSRTDTGSESYDRIAANKLFEQSGWMDADNNPATPRVAVNVSGVPSGTSLSLSLLSPSNTTSLAIASGIAKSLAGCGIEVKTTAYPFSELYAPGPEGLVFGRNFDLVLINWEYSLSPACYLYTTTQIPSAGNYWIGGNVSGYSNDEFDVACSSLMRAIPGDEDWELSLQLAAEYFKADLPALPLFKLPKLFLTRPEYCAFGFDPYARSDLSNLEIFNFGSKCNSQ